MGIDSPSEKRVPVSGGGQLKTCHLGAPADLLDMLRWQVDDLAVTPPHLVRSRNYRTMLCAVTAWQMTDWVFEDLPDPLREEWKCLRPDAKPLVRFQDWARSQCLALRICREIATGFKHRTLERDRAPDITSDTMQVLDEQLRPYPLGVLTLDGFLHNSVTVMQEALAFWEMTLGRAGLLARSDEATHLLNLEADPSGWTWPRPVKEPLPDGRADD